MSGLDGCVNSRIRQIVILFRKCLAIKEAMIESKAKSFVNELRKRYDMAFAAFVVDNMRKQNMLKEDKIAELLKDNPNEK